MKTVHYAIIAIGLLGLGVALTATVLQKPPPMQQLQQSGAKWRIVNYWSEWCAPCRREIPMLNELNETLLTTNVTIVGVNFDEDPREKTLTIAEGMGIEFPTLTTDMVADLQLRAPDVLPTTYILSPDNEVVAKMIGEQTKESLQTQLASLNLIADTD